MLPSRGLRPLNHSIRAVRSSLLTSRQFSGATAFATRGTSKRPNLVISSSKPVWMGQNLLIPSILGAGSVTARFQSTTTPSPDTSSATPPVDTTPSITDLSNTSLDKLSELVTDSTALAAIPEQIGYLKSLGLHYWPPTSLIQWTLEHIHVWAGTPWWASIVLATVFWRLVLIRPAIKGSDNIAKLGALKPVMGPIEQKLKEARLSGDKDLLYEAQRDYQAALQRANVNILSSFTPMIWQAVVGIASFRLLRHMAELPVPGLLDGGFGWVTDLTIPDPYYILPAAIAAATHLTVRFGGEMGSQNSMNPTLMKFMMYGMPGILFAIGANLPAGLQLTFATATVWGILQGRLLRNNSVRNWLGITPLYNTPVIINTTATQPISKLNIAPTYQPPTPIKTPPVEEPKGVVGGAIKEIKGTIESAKKMMTKAAGEEKNASGKSKAFIKRADKYEKDRQNEIKKEGRAARRASR